MGKAQVIKRRGRKAASILKREGVVTLLILGLQRFKKTQQQVSTVNKLKFSMLVKGEDVVKADWVTNPYIPKKTKHEAPYTINWVMSPPGPSGGGHQNIFRFIKFLEDSGHTCRVYLYSAHQYVPVTQVQENLRGSYAQTKAAKTIQWLKGDMAPADAVFATGWETAYAVFNDPGKARKFYFVQDFEPLFYSMGSEYALAENTYRFNFYGITAGGWLSNKLSTEYGMQCSHYDFGADTRTYRFENKGKRKEIFFYARPVTTRRGFELGVMALQVFHEKMPDYTITFAGWDTSEYDIPFPHVNLKDMSLKELSDVYNRCAAGLVVSLTNMSLMPLEVLACGMIPVVTDGPNNRQVSDNPYITYAPASPDALAQALIDTVTREDLPAYAEKAAKSVAGLNWKKSGEIMEAALREELNG